MVYKGKGQKKNAEGHNAPTLTSDVFDTLRHCPGRGAPEYTEVQRGRIGDPIEILKLESDPTGFTNDPSEF